MNIDDNDNIYLCFSNTPGLYKVDAGADRENTLPPVSCRFLKALIPEW